MKVIKYIAVVLLMAMLCSLLAACSQSEVPTGMHDVTAPGEDFILYVPMTWISNSRSGISGAYYTTSDHSEQGEELANHAKYWTISAQKASDDAADINAYWEKLSAYYAKTFTEFTVVPYKAATEDKAEQIYRQTSLDIYGDDAGMCAAQVYEFTARVKEFAPTEDLTVQEAMSFTRKYCQVIARAKDGDGFYVLTYSAREEDYATFIESFIHEIPDGTVVGEFVILNEKAATTQPEFFEDPDPADGMIPASTNEMPYRFYVPTAWRTGHTTEYPSAYAPTGSANVTVTIYVPSNEAISVDMYWEGYCLPEYEAVFDELTVSEQVSEGTIGVQKDAKNAKTYTFDASIGGKDYRYAQTVIVHSSLIYVVTYTALAEDGSFEQYLDDYHAMLDSFTFR
ncbi:MAG: hypothetical protein IJW70_08305 [Clostridia bacterium]|nr:hypothetical protein [Clostridia bacterium]